MLIGITGPKGAGKDTFAQPFVNFGAKNIKIADPLKEMLRTLYRMAGIDAATVEEKIEGRLKEEPCPVLRGKTPRYAMQTLGTEWRDMIGTDLWTRIWAHRVQQEITQGNDVVCTDIRFLHEAHHINHMDGLLVRIEGNADTADQHVSETEMSRIPVDRTFTNEGTRGDLHAKAIALRKEICR